MLEQAVVLRLHRPAFGPDEVDAQPARSEALGLREIARGGFEAGGIAGWHGERELRLVKIGSTVESLRGQLDDPCEEATQIIDLEQQRREPALGRQLVLVGRDPVQRQCACGFDCLEGRGQRLVLSRSFSVAR